MQRRGHRRSNLPVFFGDARTSCPLAPASLPSFYSKVGPGGYLAKARPAARFGVENDSRPCQGKPCPRSNTTTAQGASAGGKNLGDRIVLRLRLQSLHVILKLVVSGSSVTEAGTAQKVSFQPRSDRMDSIPDIQLAASGRHSSKVCARCKKRKTKVCPATGEIPFLPSWPTAT